MDISPPMPPRSLREAVRRLGVELRREPTWLPGFGSALGVTGWSALVFATGDYDLRGWAPVLPGFGLLFGPFRIWLLFHLSPWPRALAACGGVVWWTWIVSNLIAQNGVYPMDAPPAVLGLLDVITVLKLSYGTLIYQQRHRRGGRPGSG